MGLFSHFSVSVADTTDPNTAPHHHHTHHRTPHPHSRCRTGTTGRRGDGTGLDPGSGQLMAIRGDVTAGRRRTDRSSRTRQRTPATSRMRRSSGDVKWLTARPGKAPGRCRCHGLGAVSAAPIRSRTIAGRVRYRVTSRCMPQMIQLRHQWSPVAGRLSPRGRAEDRFGDSRTGSTYGAWYQSRHGSRITRGTIQI